MRYPDVILALCCLVWASVVLMAGESPLGGEPINVELHRDTLRITCTRCGEMYHGKDCNEWARFHSCKTIVSASHVDLNATWSINPAQLTIPNQLAVTQPPTLRVPEITINWDWFRQHPEELPADFKWLGKGAR